MSDVTTIAPEVHEAATCSLPLGPDGEVEILLTASDLRVRGVDGDLVIVRTRGGEPIDREVVLDGSPGRVRIRDAGGEARFGPFRIRSRRTAALDIDLPRRAQVSMRTLSGDVDAAGIAGASRWSTASGDLRLELDGGPVAIDSMSGDVELRASVATAVAARTVSGDLRVRAPLIDGLSLSTTSGDVRVEGPLGGGVEHQISSVSGDVELATSSPVRVEADTVSGDIRGSGTSVEKGGRGRRTLLIGNGSVAVSVRTTSGDVRVRGGSGAEVRPVPVAATHPVVPARPELAATPAIPAIPAAPSRPDPVPSAPALVVIAEATASSNLIPGTARPADRVEAARLEVLRALEQGELDVDAAARALDQLEQQRAQGGEAE